MKTAAKITEKLLCAVHLAVKAAAGGALLLTLKGADGDVE
jgi:hypothetical protein